MVNVGGNCVEAEDSRRDGKVEDSSIALTGELPDLDEWKKALTRSLRCYVDMWTPVSS
ncbi:hypothetical protein PVL29_023887 [Vitis rotundifolia]|uniref:Uncharacterized protein n=1 Tax=Vitis rotundifolia TaxID=103349 RepID=A0AA38YQC9_VITRO|nr:hypothetical protein PVL29_023887 [Vitis rotundifolia]